MTGENSPESWMKDFHFLNEKCLISTALEQAEMVPLYISLIGCLSDDGFIPDKDDKIKELLSIRTAVIEMMVEMKVFVDLLNNAPKKLSGGVVSFRERFDASHSHKLVSNEMLDRIKQMDDETIEAIAT